MGSMVASVSSPDGLVSSRKDHGSIGIDIIGDLDLEQTLQFE